MPSYDHLDIIAGQGTVGLEIMQQSSEIGVMPDQVLICCGGGGLGSGCAVAIKGMSSATTVHTVEPAEFDDTIRSLASGKRETNPPEARSICDALLSPSPGQLPFKIMQQLMGEGLSVTDDEVRDAMRYAFKNLKLVVEPGGAAALAALLAGKIDTRGKVTAVVISGGNVDVELFAEIQRGG